MPLHQTPAGKRNTGIQLARLILCLVLVSISCISSTINPTATQVPLATPLHATAGQPGNQTMDWLQVYFTNPNPPDNVGNGIDQYVMADIGQAQELHRCRLI